LEGAFAKTVLASVGANRWRLSGELFESWQCQNQVRLLKKWVEWNLFLAGSGLADSF
jgi:hypothetical protein